MLCYGRISVVTDGCCSHTGEGGSHLIEQQQLEAAGDLFVDVLSKMKHNGAVEKCVAGFMSLTERCCSCQPWAPSSHLLLPWGMQDLIEVILSSTTWLPRKRLRGMGSRCRLLRESDPAMQQIPRKWLDNLLASLCRPDQTLSDINRRSAGLPFAFTALFTAEPKGSHRVGTALELRPSSHVSMPNFRRVVSV